MAPTHTYTHPRDDKQLNKPKAIHNRAREPTPPELRIPYTKVLLPPAAQHQPSRWRTGAMGAVRCAGDGLLHTKSTATFPHEMWAVCDGNYPPSSPLRRRVHMSSPGRERARRRKFRLSVENHGMPSLPPLRQDFANRTRGSSSRTGAAVSMAVPDVGAAVRRGGDIQMPPSRWLRRWIGNTELHAPFGSRIYTGFPSKEQRRCLLSGAPKDTS
ncbi:hypothetical protein BDP81DRAFT_90651 [Colletotrichum phormii]|uniref:Uncharacterized protein n=1 Tax=Colletotrichum phormii TaxID=359342 RepID=A0AAJ0EMX4_9PEZI|nr:uncharacterized protein BDP81DRAFT_90651 [Colletotrichum phormii]KAK1654903.1 hypothetical protein BDP81DRAFT_90651 [Colletotrichum phormii]